MSITCIYFYIIPFRKYKKRSIYSDNSNVHNCTFPKYWSIRWLFSPSYNNLLNSLLQFSLLTEYSLFECCHYSRDDILRHTWRTYRTSANTIYGRYPPLNSNAQILDVKSLIPFWTKGNMTRHSCKHCNAHCTHHYICYTPNNKIHCQEYHQSLLLPFCTQCDSVSTLIVWKIIILWMCILRTHICKPGSLDGKNAIRWPSHQDTLLK
jgi:hypothetical protein